MKKPRIRYFLEAKSNTFGHRRREELVMAEVNAGFTEFKNGKLKYKRFKVSLEERILPENFGFQKDNFRFNRYVVENYANRSKQNSLLLKINFFENQVSTVYHYYLSNGLKPNHEEFKGELLIRLGRTKQISTEELPTLKEAFQKVIEREAEVLKSAKNKKKDNSLKPYKTVITYIERYESITNKILEFNSLDKQTYMSFWKIQDRVIKGDIICELEGHRKIATTKYGMLASSANKYQKAMKYLIENSGYTVPLDYSDKNLIADDKESRKDFYLEINEIQKIIDYQPNSPEMLLIKDYVILASLMGMRFESMGDAFGQNIEEFNNGKEFFYYIHSIQNKTNSETYIPLFKPVLDVLKRYNYTFPKFPPNSTVNKAIKRLLKECGINRIVQQKIYPYLEEPFIEKKPLFELISTHDFRKTFYTNLTGFNVAESIIELVTHPKRTRSKMSRIYNKSTLMDNAKRFYKEVTELTKDRNSPYSF